MPLLRARPFHGSFISSFFSHLPHHCLSHHPPKHLAHIADLRTALDRDLNSLLRHKILSLQWLSQGLDLVVLKLSHAHQLLPPLQFPLSPFDQKWVNDYFDQTTRILDVCNALSSDISDIEQGHLLIRHALHTLADPNTLSEDKVVRAQTSLREWLDTIQLRKEALPQDLKTVKYSDLLQDMCKCLVVPGEKAFVKGKDFLCALYEAYATTVSIFSVLALALSREEQLLSISLPPPNEISWFASMFDLLKRAREEALQRPTESRRYLEDLHLMKGCVTHLLDILDSLCGGPNFSLTEEQAEKLNGDTQALSRLVEVVAGGLDLVGKTLNKIFHAVVASRSALLDQLGSFETGDDV